MTSCAHLTRPALAAAALTVVAMLVAACGASAGSPTTPATPATVTASPAASASAVAQASAGGTAYASPVAPVSSPGRIAPAGAATFIAEGQDINGNAWHEPACHSGCVLSGDATSILYNMAWGTWTGSQAVGTGTENIEDCVPSCAAGGQYRVPVAVTFSQPVRACDAQSPAGNTASGSTRWFWSEASFSYLTGLPKALQGANAPQNPWKFTSVITQAQQSCH
jgi:hypothetical protein